jgi:Recombinase/Recombinase zinc beta ribbon domain
MLIGFASRQASKYAEDLAESVTRAKRRQAAKGLHPGGPLPDGWVKVERDDVRTYRHDPDRAPVIRRLFELAADGVPDTAIARLLNREGHRTRGGHPWNRRAVQDHVTNAWHAGRVVYRRGKADQEVFDGHHTPLVDPDTFDRIRAARPERDHGRDRHKLGRPARRHPLARLAVCGECGSAMYSYTSPHRRRDGTRQRQYRCRAYHAADGTCDMRADAEAVDGAVMDNLHHLLPDFDRWAAGLRDRHDAERRRLAEQVDVARADRDHARAIFERAQARWLTLDEADAAMLLPAVRRAERDAADADTRLRATEDALASVPADVPTDALLDFANALRDAIAGKVEGGRRVAEVNAALTEVFDAFIVYRHHDRAPDGLLPRSGIVVEPSIRPEVAVTLLDLDAVGDGELPPVRPVSPPPMAWLRAIGQPSESRATPSTSVGLIGPG